MLVISRKQGEKVLVPSINMEVRVVEIRRNGVVRLGFTAPKDVEIIRPEVKQHPPEKVEGE